MRNRLLFTAVACALMAVPFVADAKLSRSGSPSVTFNASGPAGMAIQGTTSDLNVTEDGGNVSVSVPLANLTTGIALRDKHMRDKYLQVDKYPNATLTVPRGSIKTDGSGQGQGQLTLHGVTKPAAFNYTSKKDDRGIHVTGTVRLNMNDFGIEVPKYLGVTVKPNVDVNVRFDASDS